MASRRRRLVAIGMAGAAAATVAAVVGLQAGRTPSQLPDRRLTPGATMTVTLAVLCQPGYTATVRNVPDSEKNAVASAYHWTPRPGAQEFDHLIPLEIGGSNDAKNLWPEPIAQARVKDKLENRLHALVCSRQLPLQTAQQCIATDWVACQRRYP